MLQEQMMKFALLGAEWVMWLLVLLSLACIAVAVERLIYARSNQSPRAALEKALGSFLRGADADGLVQELERIDGIEFEKRMLEHESASRRLSAHHVRLAEADHRAAERRRDDERSVIEQVARGVMRVVDAIGSESINGNGNGKKN